MSALAYSETDLRIATAPPAVQRERHRSFAEKIRLAAEALAASKVPPPAPPPAPAPVVEVSASVPLCLCSRCSAEISPEAIPAEPDPPVQAYPKIGKIQAEVAAYYGVSMIDMVSARRTLTVVRPRQVAMYLARMLTLKSLPEIGRRFGFRDHTTVLHAVRKITGLLPNDPVLAAQVAHLFNAITGEAM